MDERKRSSIDITLYGMILRILESKHLTKHDFLDLTQLDRQILYRIEKGLSARLQLRTVITICIGLSLEPTQSICLLQKAGYFLTEELPVDQAYLKLINHYYLSDIEECNGILKRLGIPRKYFLGSLDRR